MRKQSFRLLGRRKCTCQLHKCLARNSPVCRVPSIPSLLLGFADFRTSGRADGRWICPSIRPIDHIMVASNHSKFDPQGLCFVQLRRFRLFNQFSSDHQNTANFLQQSNSRQNLQDAHLRHHLCRKLLRPLSAVASIQRAHLRRRVSSSSNTSPASVLSRKSAHKFCVATKVCKSNQMSKRRFRCLKGSKES